MHKLDRVPFAHNWVRNNDPELAKMVKILVRFFDARIPITLGALQKLVRDRVVLRTDPHTLLSAAANHGHTKSRPYVLSALDAFLEYEAENRITAHPAFDEVIEPFRIGRGLKVPVQPTAVVARKAYFEPLFVFGWSTVKLSRFQRRLFMTAIEDAVFSLTDFRDAPCKVLFFPVVGTDHEGRPIRGREVWNRGDYDLLSETEIRDQVDLYIRAVNMAKEIIARRSAPPPEHRPTAPDLPLFPGE